MTSLRTPALTLLVGACLLSACHLLRPTASGSQGPRIGDATVTTQRVQQMGYGSDAHFVQCAEPLCLRTTAKVLALADAPIERDVLRAAQPTSASGLALPARAELPEAAAVVPKAAEHRRIVLRFETNSARLTAAHRASLGEALQSLRLTDHLVIVGRTDNLGSEPVNQSLALARGLAVRDYILDLAPDLPARIAIDAKGRCCYVASNGSGPGRALNRRVELIYAPRNEVAL